MYKSSTVGCRPSLFMAEGWATSGDLFLCCWALNSRWIPTLSEVTYFTALLMLGEDPGFLPVSKGWIYMVKQVILSMFGSLNRNFSKPCLTCEASSFQWDDFLHSVNKSSSFDSSIRDATTMLTVSQYSVVLFPAEISELHGPSKISCWDRYVCVLANAHQRLTTGVIPKELSILLFF